MHITNTINNVNTVEDLDLFKELMELILKDAKITQQQKKQIRNLVIVNNLKSLATIE